jgi:hypothetical protein
LERFEQIASEAASRDERVQVASWHMRQQFLFISYEIA